MNLITLFALIYFIFFYPKTIKVTSEIAHKKEIDKLLQEHQNTFYQLNSLQKEINSLQDYNNSLQKEINDLKIQNAQLITKG